MNIKNEITGSITRDESESLFESLHALRESDIPNGMIFLEQDGSVSSICAPKEVIGDAEYESVIFALDFVHHAFNRPDWMLDFIEQTQNKTAEEDKPSLTLIQGGLSEENEEKE